MDPFVVALTRRFEVFFFVPGECFRAVLLAMGVLCFVDDFTGGVAPSGSRQRGAPGVPTPDFRRFSIL
jgi:hypothetical protein